jgi:histone acetyltransferase
MARGVYTTKDSLTADVKLMFNNCRTYNGPQSVYYRTADALERVYMSKINKPV